MRRWLPLLLIVPALAAVAWLLFLQRGEEAAWPEPAAEPGEAAEAGEAGAFEPELPRQAVDVADRPTAFLRVLDGERGGPVGGASVHRAQTGEVLAFTDAEGNVGVPLARAEQLAVVAEGYLLRLCPTTPAPTAAEPQFVRLEPDRWSWRCRVRFQHANGAQAQAVRVCFRPLAEGDPAELPAGLEQAPTAVRRAWTEHTLLAALPASRGLLVQPGQRDDQRVHVLPGQGTVRLCRGGRWELRALARGGLVARREFLADAAAAETLAVVLQRGKWLTGTVVAAGGGRPLAGARLQVAGGDPLVAPATSGPDGGFRLGPLAEGSLELEASHPECEPGRVGPVAAGTSGLQVFLAPLPEVTLRGAVRAAGSRLPVAGAVVIATLPDGSSDRANTGADGAYALRVRPAEGLRLQVAAPGYLGVTELVAAGSSSLELELWPADPEVRLQQGLTALLAGIVVDDQGLPVAGQRVRLLPEHVRLPADQVGRRVVEGGAPALPLLATTAPDGTFVLETRHEGPARLYPEDGLSTQADGLPVDLVRGARRDGLRLLARRKP